MAEASSAPSTACDTRKAEEQRVHIIGNLEAALTLCDDSEEGREARRTLEARIAEERAA